jgi:hypothetical protein
MLGRLLILSWGTCPPRFSSKHAEKISSVLTNCIKSHASVWGTFGWSIEAVFGLAFAYIPRKVESFQCYLFFKNRHTLPFSSAYHFAAKDDHPYHHNEPSFQKLTKDIITMNGHTELPEVMGLSESVRWVGAWPLTSEGRS